MIRRAFFAFVAVMLYVLPAAAEIPPPSVGIRAAIDQVCLIVQSEGKTLADEVLEEKLKKLIYPLFDFNEMSKRSLGAFWNKATPAEQSEFVDLFSDLLARTYLKRIKRNAEDSKIEKITDEIESDKAMVRSIVKAQGEEVAIDYRLILQEGKWRIYDVVIENVGLVSNYRNEFPAIIRKDGMAGLLTRLRDKKIATAGRP